jgi:hypothetical protein
VRERCDGREAGGHERRRDTDDERLVWALGVAVDTDVDADADGACYRRVFEWRGMIEDERQGGGHAHSTAPPPI